MSRFRLSIIIAVVSAMCLALAATAGAETVRDTGNVPVAPPGAPYSDCTIRTALVHERTNHLVVADGKASCSGPHGLIAVTETIKAQAVAGGTIWPYSSVETPEVGGAPWVQSPAFLSGCYKWQAVTSFKDNGRQVAYQTSGTPVSFTDNCPY